MGKRPRKAPEWAPLNGYEAFHQGAPKIAPDCLTEAEKNKWLSDWNFANVEAFDSHVNDLANKDGANE